MSLRGICVGGKNSHRGQSAGLREGVSGGGQKRPLRGVRGHQFDPSKTTKCVELFSLKIYGEKRGDPPPEKRGGGGGGSIRTRGPKKGAFLGVKRALGGNSARENQDFNVR